MNFDPQKFFIGLMDFFSILLPGAFGTLLLMDSLHSPVNFSNSDSIRLIIKWLLCFNDIVILQHDSGWILFFACSYLLGHFFFLAGSFLLDNFLYEKIHKIPIINQIKFLAKGEKLSPKLIRNIAGFFTNSKCRDASYRALEIKKYYLDRLNAGSAINTFQWCKASLINDNSAYTAVIQRFEADSKFFRSLIIVLFIFFLYSLFHLNFIASFISFLFIPISFWRYMEQRQKSIMQSYWFRMTIEAEKNDGLKKSGSILNDSFTHAGGVVFRNMKGTTKFLIIQAKNSKDWVLPKGHIEPEEKSEETAVREVKEETGIWARNYKVLDFPMNYPINENENIRVQFYLMEFLEKGNPQEERNIRWEDIHKAIDTVKHKETKQLLEFVRDNYLEEIKIFK